MDFEYRTMNETQIQTSIDRYFRSASEKLVSAKAVKAYADTYVGASFNPYALLAPNEVAFSRILADLLDPKGSHAQGDKFLNLFLDLFSNDLIRENNENLARVKCEAVIDNNRRIDILIEIGSRAIAIENKPWAHEQDNQLDDYAKYILSKYDKPYLLFLHGSGVEQYTLKKYKNKLRPWNGFSAIPLSSNRKSVSSWALQCTLLSVPPKIKSYLEDLNIWIEGAC